MTGYKFYILLLLSVFAAPLFGQQTGQPDPRDKERPISAVPADSLQGPNGKNVRGMTSEQAIGILSRQGGDTLTAKELKKLARRQEKEAKKQAKELKKQEKQRREVEKYFAHIETDTTRKVIPADSLEHDPLLDSLSIPGAKTYKNEDSVMVAEAMMLKKPPAPKPKSPSHAAFLSALIPGAGQIYGGAQWWMAPIFWGGMTGTLMAVSYYNGYYNDFRDEYKYRIRTGKVNKFEYFDNETLVKRMQNVEQQRDLWIIGTAGIYLLNILHANVAVQLSEFRTQKKHRKMLEMEHMFEQQKLQQTVVPSSLTFSPSMIVPNPGVNLYPTPGIRLALAF